MDLFEEIQGLLVELDLFGVSYAVTGAVALAIHGVVRPTTNLDLLIPPAELDQVMQLAHARGFDIEAQRSQLSDGMQVQRVSKISGEESASVNLLLVNSNLSSVFEQRECVQTSFGPVWVVSREGLIQMKSWGGSGQDYVDIRRLETVSR